MPDGLVTSRPLQNEDTGIDLQVPLYQEIRGSMMTGHVEYQIVVVTRLAAFKSPKHKPGDVVQFVVSKKYSEMDEFYHSLVDQYPGVHLPPMPRKALFVGESDIRDRRAAFDELVKFISRHATLSTCSELLEFLGAKGLLSEKTVNNPDSIEDEEDEGLDFFRKDEAPAVRPVPSKPVKPAKPPPPPDDEEEEEFLDPLGNERSKKPKPPKPMQRAAQPVPKPKPKLSLFDEEEDPDDELFQPAAKHGEVKLFEDPDLGGAVKLGDSLLLPEACVTGPAAGGAALDEDVEELFRVEEDFDKLLSVSKSAKAKPALAPKPKAAAKAKPALPAKPPSLGRTPRQDGTQTMGQMDILKYIQQNEAAASDDLDLF